MGGEHAAKEVGDGGGVDIAEADHTIGSYSGLLWQDDENEDAYSGTLKSNDLKLGVSTDMEDRTTDQHRGLI